MAFISAIKLNKDPTTGVYTSGETLSGIVEITTEQACLIRAIYIKVRGVAACVWTETSMFTDAVTYFGRENYINHVIYLVGSEDGAPISIPAGLHTYHFSYVLPDEIPSSIMENHGEITYSVRLSIDQPWKEKIKHSIDFKLSNSINLNFWLTPLNEPTEMETSKMFCCGLSKPLYMRMSVPKLGFTSGQLIKMSVDVKNQSNVDVKTVRVSLMRVVQYNHFEKKLKVKRCITKEAEVTSPGVHKFQSQTLEIVLEVPSLKSTLNEFCKIITVNYELHFFADMSNVQRAPDMIMAIVIGDQPLASFEGVSRNGPAILNVQNL